ncbi:MAG: translocation/assembly module TamB domain-containing protein [Bacteroidales bacterium]|nr:translocation/assembly module TamB domain-containing protein [Bacteroidales bacterium]
MLLAALLIAVQTPTVQKLIASAALSSIEKKIDGKVSVGGVVLESANSFLLRDVVILDDGPQRMADTVFTASRIAGTISGASLFGSGGIRLSRLEITDAMAHYIYEDDKILRSNFERIISAQKRAEKEAKAATLGQPIPRNAEDSLAAIVKADDFRADKVIIKGLRFIMHDPYKERPMRGPNAINYSDLDARGDLEISDVRLNNGYFQAVLDNAVLSEKCGYSVKSVSARVKVGHGKATVEKIRFDDGFSKVNAPLYSMTSTCDTAYRNYTHMVRMKASVDKSHISTKTISAFGLGVLSGNNIALDVDGVAMEGFCNDFKVTRFKARESKSGARMDLRGTVTGITDTKNILVNLRADNLSFTTEGAARLAASLKKGRQKPDWGKYAPGTTFNFKGHVKGPLNRIHADGKVSSGIGKLMANIDLRNLVDSGRPTEIGGTLNTDGLDVGKIIANDKIGQATVNAGFHAVLNGEATSVTVDSLMVDKLNLLGYDYTGIAANGEFSGSDFDGKIICADPNLNFLFQGTFNLSPKTGNSLYKFYANIGYADLQAMNLDKRGTSKLSMTVASNFMKMEDGDLLGDIGIRDLTVENDAGRRYIGDISIGSHSNDNINRIQLESDFLDAGYVGSGNIAGILDDIQTITTRRELPSLYSRNSEDKGRVGRSYDLDVDFHDTRDLLSFLQPGLYIADSTRLELGIDRNGELRGTLNSPRVAMRKNYIKGMAFTFDNLGGSLNATMLGNEMQVGPLALKDAALTVFGDHDDFFLSFHYDSREDTNDMGEVYLAGNIFRDASDTLVLMANPLSSYMQFDGEQWDISESTISVRSRQARFKGFRLYNGSQNISIDGGVALNRKDTLSVGINGVNLGILNYFTNSNYDFGGLTSGKAVVTSPVQGKLRALVNVACDSLQVSGEQAGSMKLAAVWDAGSGKTNVYLRNIADGHDALNAKGTYYIDSRQLDLTANLDNMNLVVLFPFVSKYLDDIRGGISGEITASGPIDSLSLASRDAVVQDARLVIGYTGVGYSFNGPFHLANDGIFFDTMEIKDRKGGNGTIDGGIRFDHTRNTELDARLNLRNLEIIDTKPGTGNIYGNLFAAGTVNVSGPPEAIVVEADLRTAKSGTVHVRLGSASAETNTDLLSFTSHEKRVDDPYQAMLKTLEEELEQQKIETKGDFIARCRITATPEFTAVLELDNTGDNVLSASGLGTITANIRPATKQYELRGDYNITSGKYHFAIPGILHKEFYINSGSSLKFNGDPMDSEMDVRATHSLRTSLSRLIADTTSVSTRRTVNCGIEIYDKLLEPKLRFSIDVPDLDPATKSLVDAAINTEDKVQKQFLALLIAGSFISSEQNGVSDNSNLLYSNVSDIMSKQLSNILYKLDIPVDLGLGYQQNTRGDNLYDVSVSTELFNNRVVVYGSVGNREYSNTTAGNNASDMVGDLDIDVKLDKAGRLRLNMFSHSADDYTNYLDNSQRNGAGITYQKEFGTWKGFFRSIFTSKKKRREKARELAANPPQQNSLEITVNE